MKYQEEIKKAEELESQGKDLEAAKIFEDIGTKCLREKGIERKEAPRIIGKSIARYLLANNKAKARDLAFQVIFMKEEHPFLSLQIETAISSKTNVTRAFEVTKLPKDIDESYTLLNGIPQNRKVMRNDSEVTIKSLWELTTFGVYEKKHDLIGQKYPQPNDLVNFILSTRTGVTIVGAEDITGKKFMIVVAVTFNDNPVQVVNLKTA